MEVPGEEEEEQQEVFVLNASNQGIGLRTVWHQLMQGQTEAMNLALKRRKNSARVVEDLVLS